MARRRVSILLRRFSYGKVGTWTLSSSKAELMLLQGARKERIVEGLLVKNPGHFPGPECVKWKRPFGVPSWCGPLDAFPLPHIGRLSLHFVARGCTGSSHRTISRIRADSAGCASTSVTAAASPAAAGTGTIAYKGSTPTAGIVHPHRVGGGIK